MIPSVVFILLTTVGYRATSAFSPDNQETSSSSERSVTARSGDTIARIARRLGIPPAELAKLNNLNENARLPKGTRVYLPAESAKPSAEQSEVVGHKITLSDGYTFEADEVWKNGDEIWYRKGNVTRSLQHTVKSVSPILKAKPAPSTPAANANVAKAAAPATPIVWINLVGGARFRVDEVQETNDGAWYSRANISIFIAKERIKGIDREYPDAGTAVPARNNRDWTSGNPTIDQLIKSNGARFGVDPYLVFLVIEQESQFHTRALSPKGARGLMQLMPGTARRLGVSRPFDAAENIRGGTRYLRELMDMFGGDVNLVLASYNAGEGAVIKYGRNVPPYRETRDYVRTIGKRYGLAGRKPDANNEVPTPQK